MSRENTPPAISSIERFLELLRRELLGCDVTIADEEVDVDNDDRKIVRSLPDNRWLIVSLGPEGGVGSDVLVLKTSAKSYKITLGGSKAAAREALEAAGLL